MAAIVAQINSGALSPGDRVPTLSTLMDEHQVSQRVVTAALKALVLERKLWQPKRGCFYVTDALGNSVGGPQSPQSTAPSGPSYGSESNSKALRVCVTDSYSLAMDYWRRLLDEFRELRPELEVELVSMVEMEAQEEVRRGRIDVVMASEACMNRIGGENLQALNIDVLGLKAEDMIHPVRRTIERGDPIVGIPFAANIPLLFVNHVLYDRMDMAVPERLEQLLNVCEIINNKYPNDVYSIGSRFHSFALMAGAIGRRGKEIVVEWPMVECLMEDIKARMKGILEWNHPAISKINGFDAFAKGYSMMYCAGSHAATGIPDMDVSKVGIYPAPFGVDAQGDCILASLGVQKNTLKLNEAIEFMTFACSDKWQAEYGALGGNVPVLNRVIDTPQVQQAWAGRKVNLQEYLKCVEVFAWPPTPAAAKITVDIDYCTDMYWRGDMSLEDVIKRLKLLFGFYANRAMDEFVAMKQHTKQALSMSSLD